MDEGKPQELDDEMLARRVKETNDPACFEELFLRHRRRVYAKCRSVLRDNAAAEDLTQETFLRALSRIHQYEPGNFGAWLSKIAYCACLNWLKSGPLKWERAGLGAEPVGQDSGQNSELAQDMTTILAQLSEPQRVCLKLRFGHGYTYEQITALTGYSHNDIKSHIQNGRRRFDILWKGKVIS